MTTFDQMTEAEQLAYIERIEREIDARVAAGVPLIGRLDQYLRNGEVRFGDPDSIAQWFTDHHTWAEILDPAGWTLVAGDGEQDGSQWRHPTATSSHSATIRHGCLFIYSTSTAFEVTNPGEPAGYTRFRAWATLEHGGDLTAASSAARRAKRAGDIADRPHPDGSDEDGGRSGVKSDLTPGADSPHSPQDDPDESSGALPDGHRATDAGNAARFLELANGRVRFVHAWGRWLVYVDGRWVIDGNDVVVTELAKGVARNLLRVAAGIEGDRDWRERTWKWAIRCEQAGTIVAMLRLARGGPGVLVEHEQLDANPYLLNCPNGTVDLRTGRLHAHDPADLITRQCPVAFDPQARSALWDACLERWQPDAGVRDYLQRRSGAAATGLHTETLDIDYGDGANGKSKFHGALQHVLGDNAVVPHKSLIVAQRHEQHPTEIAALFRKRYAVTSETSSGTVLNDEQVKYLTGGDRLKGRRMREDPWEFWPSHTLVMFANHRPAIHGRDLGIWRRVRLVPWEVTIPDDEQDEELPVKLRGEAPGILAWIVEGARRFLADGLAPPEHVRAATERYRAEEDVIGRFVADVLEFGQGFAYSCDIKDELAAWCAEQDATPPSMNDIAAVLRQRGARDGGRKQYKFKRSTIWHEVSIRGKEAS